MTNFEVKAYTPEYLDRWNSLAKGARAALFLFERGFLEYHSDRFFDASVLIFSGNKLRGIFPANAIGSIVYSHQGLTYGGLLTGSDVKAYEIQYMLQVLADYYRSTGISKIYYKKIPECFSTVPCAEDEYFLYLQGARLVRRDLSSVIDFSSRPKLSDSRKNVLKKARDQGFKVAEIVSASEFHHLLSNALAKHATSPVHSAVELELLIGRFPDAIKLHGCYFHGELYAAACLFDFGHICHAQYLAASDEARKVGALDHLLECLIQDAGRMGKRYFSFGISTEDAGRTLNYGLIAQKEGFGARGVVADSYEWDLQ